MQSPSVDASAKADKFSRFRRDRSWRKNDSGFSGLLAKNDTSRVLGRSQGKTS